MIQEEILEYNRRCALFCTTEPEVLERDLEKAGTLESMQFHSDWNWIMEICISISMEFVTTNKEQLIQQIYDKLRNMEINS